MPQETLDGDLRHRRCIAVPRAATRFLLPAGLSPSLPYQSLLRGCFTWNIGSRCLGSGNLVRLVCGLGTRSRRNPTVASRFTVGCIATLRGVARFSVPCPGLADFTVLPPSPQLFHVKHRHRRTWVAVIWCDSFVGVESRSHRRPLMASRSIDGALQYCGRWPVSRSPARFSPSLPCQSSLRRCFP